MDDGGCETIKWTKSIAVGSREFVNRVQINLGGRANGRKIQGDEVGYQLREPSETYSALSGMKNTCDWNFNDVLSAT